MGVDYCAFWGIEYTEAEYLATFFDAVDVTEQAPCCNEFHCKSTRTVTITKYTIKPEWAGGDFKANVHYPAPLCVTARPFGIEKIRGDGKGRHAVVWFPFAHGPSHRSDRPHKVITAAHMEYAQRITALITERTGKAPTVILRTYASC
jgi:hypothetical protein